MWRTYLSFVVPGRFIEMAAGINNDGSMVFYLLSVAAHEGLLLSEITKVPVQKNKIYFSVLVHN